MSCSTQWFTKRALWTSSTSLLATSTVCCGCGKAGGDGAGNFPPFNLWWWWSVWSCTRRVRTNRVIVIRSSYKKQMFYIHPLTLSSILIFGGRGNFDFKHHQCPFLKILVFKKITQAIHKYIFIVKVLKHYRTRVKKKKRVPSSSDNPPSDNHR